MAQGGQKTPPNNCSPVLTHSRSDSTVIPETATTSEAQPIIHVEPATLLPWGIDVQDIIQNSRQSIIRTQDTLLDSNNFVKNYIDPFIFPINKKILFPLVHQITHYEISWLIHLNHSF